MLILSYKTNNACLQIRVRKWNIFFLFDTQNICCGTIKYHTWPRIPRWKVTNSQKDITNESQDVSSFPVGDHKASINMRARKYTKQKIEAT